MNKVYFDDNYGWFIGQFNNNNYHQHYAIQLSIGLNDDVEIIDLNGKSTVSKSILVKSNISHQLNCDSTHLLLLFNPISKSGHFLQNQKNSEVSTYRHTVVNELRQLAIAYTRQEKDFPMFVKSIQSALIAFDCECENNLHIGDKRILKALGYLKQNKDRVVSLKEIADQIHLSQSRFLHLFKEQTNITYRRAQLWLRMSESLPYLKTSNITSVAHQFGFTDSAHYTKIFKQNFGFTPKILSKQTLIVK